MSAGDEDEYLCWCISTGGVSSCFAFGSDESLMCSELYKLPTPCCMTVVEYLTAVILFILPNIQTVDKNVPLHVETDSVCNSEYRR